MQTGIAVSSMHSIIASAHAALLGVEADDEAGVHEHAGAIDLVDALGDAAAGVLLLLHRDERLGVGALDADEDRRRSSPPASCRSSSCVVGEVDRGLGRELERIVVRLEPRAAARAGTVFSAFLLPMRLSSTKSTWPR